MKGSLKYIIIVIILIVLVVSITLSTLFIKYKEQGKFNVIRKNFDVVFTNQYVKDNNVKLKINNDKDYLHIDISNIDKEASIDVDVMNIANIDALVKNFSYSNIDTNARDGEIVVTTSINNGDIIKKGDSKKLNIVIKNNSVRKDIYYNFNINYLFEEYNL